MTGVSSVRFTFVFNANYCSMGFEMRNPDSAVRIKCRGRLQCPLLPLTPPCFGLRATACPAAQGQWPAGQPVGGSRPLPPPALAPPRSLSHTPHITLLSLGPRSPASWLASLSSSDS